MEPRKNYQKELEQILDGLCGARPRLLLHSCCGPCSSYVLVYLMDYFDITVYYYNPCIAPAEEYEHRKTVQQGLIRDLNAAGCNPIAYVEGPYEHETFLRLVRGHEEDREGGERCHLCYEQRLAAAGAYAAEHGFDWFCTTLSVSPYKNAQLLNETGLRIGQETGVPYLVSDFKKKNGYKRSIELSQEYGLYRQCYCGCEFSLRDVSQH